MLIGFLKINKMKIEYLLEHQVDKFYICKLIVKALKNYGQLMRQEVVLTQFVN